MKNIAAALVKAQRQFQPALKTSTNPHFRTKYADLAACVEAVLEALNANGIALVQTTHECADGVMVETMFLHESGESLQSGKLHVPATKQDAQGYGSALTYARRYSLMAACGIAPEDDDGNAAAKKPPGKTAATDHMPPGTVADWIAAIKGSASLDELTDAKNQALASAEQMKDRDAYQAFRHAALERHKEIA